MCQQKQSLITFKYACGVKRSSAKSAYLIERKGETLLQYRVAATHGHDLRMHIVDSASTQDNKFYMYMYFRQSVGY